MSFILFYDQEGYGLQKMLWKTVKKHILWRLQIGETLFRIHLIGCILCNLHLLFINSPLELKILPYKLCR